MEKLYVKFLKMFFVELMFEYFIGGNILWGFYCLLVFGSELNNYIQKVFGVVEVIGDKVFYCVEMWVFGQIF